MRKKRIPDGTLNIYIYMRDGGFELSYEEGKIGKVLVPKVKEREKRKKNVFAPSFVCVRILYRSLSIEH
jgi:hypothetical protein